MATKTQITPSSSRVRFGFAHKRSRPRVQPELPEHADDGDWYIPYNGPYELPPTIPRSQNRDSWGQLLGSVLGNLGSAKASEAGHERSDGRMASGQHITSAFPSSGAYSSHPYRMNAPLDVAGTSQGRGAVSSSGRGGRPTLITTSSTAFANIDNTGGVGESPTPVQRSSPLHPSPPSSALNRLSLGSFLTFGGSTRKSRSDSVHGPRQPSAKRSRNGIPTPDPLQSNRATLLDAQPSRSHSPLSLNQTMGRNPRQRSHTLMGTSISPVQTSSPSNDSSTNSFYNRESPLSAHPYAHTFPSSRAEATRRAPIVPPSAPHSSDKGKGVDRSYRYPRPPALDTLNNTEVPAHLKPASRTSLFKTISAPNLHNISRGVSTNKSSRGKSRWLSPETWCDALLFPRPRFMEYIDDEPPEPFGHRHATPTPVAEVHPAREHPKPVQMALRGSHSAVSLHAPMSEASRGPPRAEPMLMAREPPNASGPSSPVRPRSFAQDDLALPSPVPSLARVLEMGASFDRERATWKAHATRSLQSSKRTRSLGRSRSQSVGRARAQLKDAGGVEFLATRTLLGNQFAAPIIHARTPSDSTQTQQTRSGASHVRTMSSSGISRAGSKGKAALRAATVLCMSGDRTSPQTERFDAVSRNDSRGNDTHIEISPRKPDFNPSPSPPVTIPSDVGVALSSPPPSVEGGRDEPPRPAYMEAHPYAQGGRSASRRSHARSSSDYAGPHPSAVSITATAAALTSDMSARHRLPPHVALHPYASALAYPNSAPSRSPSVVPPVLPSESTQPPQVSPTPRPQLSDARETQRGARHAYVLSNRFSGEPLALADALLYGPQRRLSADSGLGDSENHSEAPTSAAQPFIPLPNFIFTTPSERLDPAHGSTFLSLSSIHTVPSSPPETLNPPVFTASMLSYSLHSAQTSLADEPLQGSRSSSPQQSPQPFSGIEDLERYRNLFYRPRGSGLSRTPSSEHRRMLSRDTGSLIAMDTSSNSRVSGGSGLTILTRQLSNELEVFQDMRRQDGGSDSHSSPRMWGLRYGGLRGNDGMGSRTDPNAVLSIASDSDVNSPDAATLPLRLHQDLGHQSIGSLTINIPQDVASRTSSQLDRSEIEDVDHDELLRMGTVEAVSTPAATAPTHRLSFIGDVHGGYSQESLQSSGADDEEHPLLPPLLTASPLHQGSRASSLLPAAIHSATTEVTRTSYQTDGTGTSRISGLSDFPAPPTQTIVSSDRVELLKSYFGGEAHSRPVSHTTSSPRLAPAPAPASSVSSSSSSRLQRAAFGESSRLSHERPRDEDAR